MLKKKKEIHGFLSRGLRQIGQKKKEIQNENTKEMNRRSL